MSEAMDNDVSLRKFVGITAGYVLKYSAIWSTHTFIETTTMLRLQRVSTFCDVGNGAGGEVGFSAQAPTNCCNLGYA